MVDTDLFVFQEVIGGSRFEQLASEDEAMPRIPKVCDS